MRERSTWIPFMGALAVVLIMAVAGRMTTKQHSDWYEGTADHYYAQPGSYQPIGANHVN